MYEISKSNVVKFLVRGHESRDIDALIHPDFFIDYERMQKSNGLDLVGEDPWCKYREGKIFDDNGRLPISLNPRYDSEAAPLDESTIVWTRDGMALPYSDYLQLKSEGSIHVVEYAYGLEGYDSETTHDHTHVVVRLSEQVDNNPAGIRRLFNIDGLVNIQDIRLGDNFYEAARYACKCGKYEWPTQDIPKPYNIAEPHWYDFQAEILRLMDEQTHRQILCVVDSIGGSGKSFLATWLELRFKAVSIPVTNNYKDVMRYAYDISVKHRRPFCKVFVDIPRAFPKKDLRQLYAGLESIKDGHCWDDRYDWQKAIVESPKMCVMTNMEPDWAYLTQDRWVVMYVKPDRSFTVVDRASLKYDFEAEYSKRAALREKNRLRMAEYRAKKKEGMKEGLNTNQLQINDLDS